VGGRRAEARREALERGLVAAEPEIEQGERAVRAGGDERHRVRDRPFERGGGQLARLVLTALDRGVPGEEGALVHRGALLAAFLCEPEAVARGRPGPA
jgi:hypothetical protein